MTIDIDAIRQREQAAEPAPWRVVEEHGRDIADEGWSRITIQTDSGRRAGHEIAELSDPDVIGASQIPMDNAEFIAHARQDVPALLAEVERLRAELEQVREAAHRRDLGINAERAQWQAEIAHLRDLVRQYEHCGVVPVEAINKALRDGPPAEGGA